MDNLQKQKPIRSEKYLKWIRSQPCCLTHKVNDITAHHIISCGMGGTMGGKASDLFAIPLHAEVHARLHAFPHSVDIDQKAEALKMIEKAFIDGVLKFE